MKRRMTMATAVASLALALLAGCGSEGSAGETAAPPASSSETPDADPDAAAMRGDWEITAEDYVLHLEDDGRFVEDFQGIVGFRTGTYEVDGDTISLVGGDGNTDKGTIAGETLEFTLGTATRLE